jgi:hypothetical protein
MKDGREAAMGVERRQERRRGKDERQRRKEWLKQGKMAASMLLWYYKRKGWKVDGVERLHGRLAVANHEATGTGSCMKCK